MSPILQIRKIPLRFIHTNSYLGLSDIHYGCACFDSLSDGLMLMAPNHRRAACLAVSNSGDVLITGCMVSAEICVATPCRETEIFPMTHTDNPQWVFCVFNITEV
jgi:hypothetical protein